MFKNSHLSTVGIVLRRREYGDFDLIVTFLTQDHGKITLIAKSAKKSAKRFPGILEPFSQLQISFRKSRGNGMAILEEASLNQSVAGIRSDFLKIAYASYWVECIILWMEEGRVRPDIYLLLSDVLQELNNAIVSADMLSILFQMRFIGQEGLQPIIESCTHCQTHIDKLSQFDFCVDLGKGGVVCNQCSTGSHHGLRLAKGTLKQLLWVVDGDLAKAKRVRFSRRTMAEATAFLETFVPYHIGRIPKSLRILQQTRKGA